MKALTHAAFWRATWPVVISQASIPLLSLSDTFVASHSGAAHGLPALVLGAKIYEFVGLVFFFLAISTCTLVSKTVAQKDEVLGRLWLYRSLFLAVVISVFVVPLVFFIAGPWLKFLGADSVTFAPAQAYVHWRLLGLPALILLESFMGFFLGRLASRAVMTITLVMNLLNVILNLIFVLGMEQGVEGIAWATAISQWVGVICACWLFMRAWRATLNVQSCGHSSRSEKILRSEKIFGRQKQRWQKLFALAPLRYLIRANLDLLIRSICVLGYLQGITFMSGAMGRVMVAAMGVAMTVMLAASFIQDSLARSTEVFVSRTDQNRMQLVMSLKLCGTWFFGAALFFGVCFWAGEAVILQLFGLAPSFLEAAQALWPFLVIYVSLQPVNYFLNSALFGLQAFSALRNIYAVSFVVFVLSVILLFEPQPIMIRMWMCIGIFDLSRCVLMGAALMRALSCILPRELSGETVPANAV